MRYRRAQQVRLSTADLQPDFASFHQMKGALVVALHVFRWWLGGDFGDVVPGEVNRAQYRREDVAGRPGIRTGCK
jgi:hypothetical protein